MSFNFDLKEVTIEYCGKQYCLDFNVEFDLYNPKAEIYNNSGDITSDRGQDEVYFRQVWIKNGIELGTNTNISMSDTYWIGGELDEVCLDWCRDNPEMHIEAFKHAKGYK